MALADVLASRSPPGDEIVPFNNVRRRAATALLASKRTLRTRWRWLRSTTRGSIGPEEASGLTALPFVARAVIDALREFPLLNATVDGEALVVHRAVNLGIAVDLDYQGLVVPVVRDADGLAAAESRALDPRRGRPARAKQLGPDDLAGGTFTITNPGAAGTWISFPILNAPQVGILSTDGVAKRCGRRLRRFAHRARRPTCASRSTTALDGAYAGAFLDRVREIIEHHDWAAEVTEVSGADPGFQGRAYS